MPQGCARLLENRVPVGQGLAPGFQQLPSHFYVPLSGAMPALLPQGKMWHGWNCPKQCLAGKSLNNPPCSLQEGAQGSQPLQGWPQKPRQAFNHHRPKLCSPSLWFYLQRELRPCWENLPCALITACRASSKWLFVNENQDYEVPLVTVYLVL